jgi:hypothetical protein
MQGQQRSAESCPDNSNGCHGNLVQQAASGQRLNLAIEEIFFGI